MLRIQRQLVFFGKPQSNLSGGIVYNDVTFNPNGFDFRTNGNISRMVLTDVGNLGVGTIAPGGYKLKISHGSLGLDIEQVSTGDDWELFTFDNLQLFFNGSFRGQFSSTSGAYTFISDERLKTNIKPMATMLDKINKLKPSTYQFKNTTDKQEYNGFIAQDVLKLFPSLVMHNVNKEHNLDVYTMDYSGFGVIAVKGIQELQPIIEEQRVKILALEDRLAKLESALANVIAQKGLSNVAAVKDATLEQNQPNPSNGSTIIRYHIPAQNANASIVISDIKGSIIKTFVVSRGSGEIALNNKALASGTYSYSLLIDGKKVDTKQMVITK